MVTTPLDADLAAALRRLRLGRLVPTLAERIALAEKQGMRFTDLLLLILTDEIARRDSSAAERRAQEAGLAPDMVVERFDAGANITYDKRLFAELCSLRFLEQHKHVTLLGAVGVGKTFVANALGHLACQHGYRVHFTRADAMLHRLRQSRFDNSRDDQMHALTTVDVLILDDFAIEPMTRDESKDVYQLFVERTGQASMILTSNQTQYKSSHKGFNPQRAAGRCRRGAAGAGTLAASAVERRVVRATRSRSYGAPCPSRGPPRSICGRR
jgi:DNA replication protein DnaC